MMVDVRINGVKIDIKNDFNVSHSIKDSLGYATFELLLDDKITLKYFDKVEINNDKFYLVDFKEINKGHKYQYNIDVATPEIKLQNIILPNRAPVAEGTKGDYLEKLIELYSTNFILDSEIINYFKHIPMVEYTWSKPTLFEVLNDIVQENGKIIKMYDYDTITIRDINYRGEEFSGIVTNENYNSDYENYASGFNTTINNAISDNLVKEYVNFSTPDSPILEDNNFAAYLSQPIERITKLELVTKGWGKINTPGGLKNHIEQVRVSVLDMLLEKTIYDTKLNGVGGKVDYLFYEYGNNIIGGFDYNESKWWGGNLNTWEWLVDRLETKGSYNDMVNTDILDVMVYVEYVAKISEIDVEVKNAKLSDKKIVVYNQDEPIINMDNFAKKQATLINRSSGNKLELHGTGTPPQLLDTYKGYTIYNIIISKYKWTAHASENYIDVNIRTKVNSEKMFTSIVSQDKALLMNHITNYDFVLTDVELNYNKLVDNFNLLNNSANKTYLLLKPNTVEYYLLKTPFLEKYNNSLLLHFKMNDNYSAGNKLLKRNVRGAQDLVPYTDIDGNLDNIEINLYNGDYDDILLNNIVDLVDRIEFPITYPDVNYIYPYKSIVGELPEINNAKKPLSDVAVYNLVDLFKSDKLLYRDNLLRYKTTREILAETIQLNLLSNDTTYISPNYINALNWGESVVNNFQVRYQTDGTKYTINNFNHGAFADISDLSYNEGSYTLNVSGNITGWAVFNNNDILFYYNGSAKTLFINKGYKAFEFDIIDEQVLTISTPTKTMEEIYNFNIIDEQQLFINVGARSGQEFYTFNILDKQELYLGLGSKYVQKTYEFSILDQQPLSLNGGSNYVQQEYEFIIVDEQDLNIWFRPEPMKPSQSPNSSNYGQVVIGADGYSEWECKRNSQDVMTWVKSGTTTDGNLQRVNEGDRCYSLYDAGRDTLPIGGIGSNYVRYLCEVTGSEYTYYWELKE